MKKDSRIRLLIPYATTAIIGKLAGDVEIGSRIVIYDIDNHEIFKDSTFKTGFIESIDNGKVITDEGVEYEIQQMVSKHELSVGNIYVDYKGTNIMAKILISKSSSIIDHHNKVYKFDQLFHLN